jgi:hypothetical protein
MDKKAKSKPMREIISRLEASGEFEIVNFGDERILGAPISEWPRVDCLMSWYRCAAGLCTVYHAVDASIIRSCVLYRDAGDMVDCWLSWYRRVVRLGFAPALMAVC